MIYDFEKKGRPLERPLVMAIFTTCYLNLF